MSAEIAFYQGFPFHRDVLKPVHALVKDEVSSLYTAHLDLVLSATPKIVVMADRHYELLRQHLPEAQIVFLRHGFASKNNLWLAVSGCDYACLNSDWVKQDCLSRGIRPVKDFWITGFVPADVLFSESACLPVDLREQGFSPARKTILYAPTYNEHLSSAGVLGSAWLDGVIDQVGDVNIIIKPHPVTPLKNPGWMDMWRDAQNRHDYVYLIEDTHASVYAYCHYADVLLSDASSVIFYFLALDRPIVLVKNANRHKETVFYDEDGPEWTWRDVGIEIEIPADLPQALSLCLRDPGQHAAQRKKYSERVFGQLTDGRSAQRAASKLLELTRS